MVAANAAAASTGSIDGGCSTGVGEITRTCKPYHNRSRQLLSQIAGAKGFQWQFEPAVQNVMQLHARARRAAGVNKGRQGIDASNGREPLTSRN